MGQGCTRSLVSVVCLMASVFCMDAYGQTVTTTNTIEMCLNSEFEKLQDHRGVGNFAFTGKIYGSANDAAKGYFIVAHDTSGAGWIQANTGLQPGPGKFNQTVRFGVSNVSAYPLRFSVIQGDATGAFSYAELERYARTGIHLDMDSSSVKGRIVTHPRRCVVDLENGRPRVIATCACPA
jgi:hypothetical protein